MRPPTLIEDADDHERRLREEDDERRDERERRWEEEDRAGLGPWRMDAHRLARRERERRRALDDREEDAA